MFGQSFKGNYIPYGYNGSNCASDFGSICANIELKTVRFVPVISVLFVPRFDPAHRAALKDQLNNTLSLK